MFIIVEGPFEENTHVMMQRAGYHTHRFSAEISYTKRIGGGEFPRFHVYPEVQGESVRLNLHLDMKKHTYGGFSAHQGEYDGKRVEEEMERLRLYFEKYRV